MILPEPMSISTAWFQTVLARCDGLQSAASRGGSTIEFTTSSQGGLHDDVAPILVTAILTFGVLAMLWMRTRARLEAKRIDALRELGLRGQISAATIEAHLKPPSPLRNVVMLLAWFGLFGGSAMIVIGVAGDWWGDAAEIGSGGIAVLVASLATLSAPIALRELRKQSTA